MEELFDIRDIIFEVSKYRSDLLKDIDVAFSQIKMNNKDLAAKKELTLKIKQFTNIKNVVISFKHNYLNACVIPIYNQVISSDLINNFKDFEKGNNLKNLNVIEEPSIYIKKIYIIFGNDMINTLSSRELTSVLLHEFGHVFTYTSNLPRILLAFFEKFLSSFGLVAKMIFAVIIKILAIPIIYGVFSSLLFLIIIRSLTFTEHQSEYRADQFPIKYGYGDEFLKVLRKFHIKQVEIEKQKAWYRKIWESFRSLTTVSSHPAPAKRIQEISEKITNEYKLLYPKLSKELSIILKEVQQS